MYVIVWTVRRQISNQLLFKMKIKLESKANSVTKHQWIVESKNDPDILDVTTPNGHHMQFAHGMRTLESLFEQAKEECEYWNRNRRDNLEIVMMAQQVKHCSLISIIPCGRDSMNGILKELIKTEWNSVNDRPVSPKNILQWQINFTNHVLQYDRECESVRCLQVLANFAEHLVTRPSIMDCFTGMPQSVFPSENK